MSMSTVSPEKQALIAPIINQTVSVELLATLCCVSRACATLARNHLYRELELIENPLHESPFFPGQKLSFDSREKRRHTIYTNSHLWPYIRALTLSIDQEFNADRSYAIPFTEILEKVKLPNVDHIFLQIGRNNLGPPEHFRIVDPLRGILEGLLSSPSMRSFSIDLYTTYSSNNPFPGWIFRNLSDTVKDVELAARWPGWADSKDFRIPSIAPTSDSGPKRTLESFSLVVRNNDETMAHCLAILSGLCFNFSFSRMRELKITHIDKDAGMWTLPDLSAETLEDLTILSFPNRDPFLSDNHFSAYHNLRSLSIQLSFDSTRNYNTCQSLIDLFSQPLPSTLHHVSITVGLGKFLGKYDVPQLFDAHSPEFVDMGCWRELSKIIAESHPSIRGLATHLTWTVEIPTTWTMIRDDIGKEKAAIQWSNLDPSYREMYRELLIEEMNPSYNAEEVAKWKEAVQVLIVKWKGLFWRVQRRCNLDVHVKIRQERLEE
ncbi:hypothetical protein EST38_g9365 [Candolleomyces aberdarensis]|uniref:Uncharacterized protein n=1 Tax=Candolleomyces aberdarensis TaxID=2316362 RepID=A0A4Q2DA40_9AGAR|nr:hypothetical protein EST38_g9365 [Candolleomyces aberdarensis]